MADPRPFSPQWGSNVVSIIGAAGNAIVQVSGDSGVIRVVNSGAGDLYVRCYNSAAVVVASNKDFCVRPGMASLVFKGDTYDRVSAYSLAGTTAEVMVGEGGV